MHDGVKMTFEDMFKDSGIRRDYRKPEADSVVLLQPYIDSYSLPYKEMKLRGNLESIPLEASEAVENGMPVPEAGVPEEITIEGYRKDLSIGSKGQQVMPDFYGFSGVQILVSSKAKDVLEVNAGGLHFIPVRVNYPGRVAGTSPYFYMNVLSRYESIDWDVSVSNQLAPHDIECGRRKVLTIRRSEIQFKVRGGAMLLPFGTRFPSTRHFLFTPAMFS